MTLAKQSYDAFYQVFHDIKTKGKQYSPRGQKVLEIENYNYVLPPYVRFASFTPRKLKLDYIKTEFLWYLSGYRYDKSIAEQASLWKTLINEDGSINSNYGQYMFFPHTGKNQFSSVIDQLTKDKDSRRASMVILNRDHVLSDTNDLPCTYAMNFRIRDNKLNMSVRMRSQDMVYGMGNDAPTFSFTHEMVYTYLSAHYDDLELGEYYHSVDSAHVYERHFDMMEQILAEKTVEEVNCPRISCANEVIVLKWMHNFPSNFDWDAWEQTRKEFKFTEWLTNGQFENVYKN